MSAGQAGGQAAGLNQVSLVWRRFIRWWMGELTACIPAGVRRSFSSQHLVVLAGAESADVLRPGQAAGRPLGQLLLAGDGPARVTLPDGVGEPPWGDGDPCRVILDGHAVLHRTVPLPVEAERNLRGVLLASMERYTPLPVAEIYFDYFIRRRQPEVRKLEVALYLAPKARINALVERLRGVGLVPESVDVRGEGDAVQGVGVNLLPIGGLKSDRRWLLVNRVLATTALLLLAAVLVVPVVKSRAAVDRLSAEVAAQRESVQQAEQTRAQVDARLAVLKRLEALKIGRPSTVEILAEITRLIPDSAWARQVELREDRVRISGEAESASDLIRLLTASALFSDPRFEAPLTQNPRTNRERFVISLALPATREAE